jgi:hypothetical protein
MPSLVQQLQKQFPTISFVPAESFYWSPRKQVVNFVTAASEDNIGAWSLLHELGHALLEHKNYGSDFELLSLELAAWEKAQVIAQEYDIVISSGHIQDCLDTYREWLYLRSTCPQCMSGSQQIEPHLYSCFNCNTTWRVSRSRQCRSYRQKLARI